MAFIFEGRRITSPLTGTDAANTTDFLVDNIGDVINIEIDVRSERYRVAVSSDEDSDPNEEPFIKLAPILDAGTFPDARAVWISDTLVSWSDFNVGDKIAIIGATIPSNNKVAFITEKVVGTNGTTSLITDTLFLNEVMPINSLVANITDITAITYSHGIIGNSEVVNYISKVDGSEQIAQLGGLDNNDLVYRDATLLGNKSWQSGSIQIKGNGSGNANPLLSSIVQAFTIKHELIVNPLMLADEWQDILDGIKPDILLNEASLRYVFRADAAPVLKNPNQTAEVLFSEFTGNVGGDNENFNGGPTNYSISDVVYSRVPSGEVTSSLELTPNESKVTFTVTNTEDEPFSDSVLVGNTKGILKFNYAPSNENEYRDDVSATSENMEHNFMFDDVLSTLGGTSGLPRQSGTDGQIIKRMTFTYVSDSVIEVDARIQLSSSNLSRLSAQVDRRFQIKFSVADHTLLRQDSDKVSLTVDNGEFFNDLTDPTLIQSSNSFMEHTGSIIGTDNIGSLTARAEDDICCITSFAIDKNGRETDDITMSGVRMQIVARKDADTFDVLDEYATNLNLTSIDGVPFVDVTEDRGFATPADSLRKNVRIKRREDLDAPNIFSYEARFPIVMRWEYWEPRANANDDFFDPTQPNNGLNHDWVRINNTSGWGIYYRTTISIIKNGNPLTFVVETQIGLDDYLVGTEWNAENIKTFINSTGDPIFDSPNYGISLKEDTLVRAEMTYLGIDSYIPSDLVSVLKINAFERGNFKEQYTLSSLYPPHENTKWIGVSPETMALITNPSGDIWRTAGILVADLLDDDISWRISQRIYNPPFTNIKLRSGGGTDKKLRSGLTDRKLRSGN